MTVYNDEVYVSDSGYNTVRKMTCDLVTKPPTTAPTFTPVPTAAPSRTPSATPTTSPSVSFVPSSAPSTAIPTSTLARCTINDFAGIERTSNNAYAGDGGQASSAKFSAPYGVWANSNSQELYVADLNNNRARKVNLNSNLISLVAGGASSGTVGATYPTGNKATASNIYLKPHHVCGDSAGTIYLVEQLAFKVRKVTSAGILSTFAGSGTYAPPTNGAATSSPLTNFYHCTVDSSADVYLAVQSSNTVNRVKASTGIMSLFAGNGQSSPIGLNGPTLTSSVIHAPYSLFIDSLANLFVSDSGSNLVRKTVLGSNTLTTVAGEL